MAEIAASRASDAEGRASDPSSELHRNSPPKGDIFFTLLGSFKERVPSKSPASITAPRFGVRNDAAFRCDERHDHFHRLHLSIWFSGEHLTTVIL